ncbi:BsuPI-related putative proteinase inhibitor [Cytobacillus sp. S13-E01]|uniref:BsuPI-related putative proteinase inhibitor n=1 Tax=Cytobacillus sp. S13-E01 TaxID=3031326 RepID=UPI0023D8260A|nr:BsuPI-related putative proteinase inhibitor [Cytobacillus sp. S13-E01]MDF0726989.1 BsuPI-related putative proteinase inhibitor [Cytobacillus sp. S13-E01]
MKRFFLLFIMSILVVTGCTIETTKQQEQGEGKMEQEQNALEFLNTSVDIQTTTQSATLLIALKNTGEKDITLTFTSGQMFEIVINDESGNEMYRYSIDKMFTMAIKDLILKPGEKKVWQEKWDYKTQTGESVEPGNYKAIVSVVASKVNGISATSSKKLKAEKEFTVPQHSNAFRNIKVTGEDGFYHVTGEARVFEASFFYSVEDGHNYVIPETVQTAREGAPTWSKFEIAINITKDKLPQNGVLLIHLFERSAKDGSVVNSYLEVLEQFQ